MLVKQETSNGEKLVLLDNVVSLISSGHLPEQRTYSIRQANPEMVAGMQIPDAVF